MQTEISQKAQPSSGLFLYKTIQDTVLDWIFPPACVHCGRVDWHFCNPCIQELQNLPLENHLSQLAPLAGIISTAQHKGIAQSAVQALKYHQGLMLAPFLATRMAVSLQTTNWIFDTIIPVPLSSARLRERGYNQANEISKILAEQLNIPHQAEALQKVRHTQSQVGLNSAERNLNVKAAFSANSSLMTGKVLLLVDDVKTTGATLAECAQTALNAGASAVYAITVTTVQV